MEVIYDGHCTEAFPELTFVGFIGDLDYLIGKINNSTTLTTSPIIHSASSGMLCELGIDLGRTDIYTYYNFIDIRYSEVQSRLMSHRLFKRGSDVIPFDVDEVKFFDGTTDEIRAYSPEESNDTSFNLLFFVDKIHDLEL